MSFQRPPSWSVDITALKHRRSIQKKRPECQRYSVDLMVVNRFVLKYEQFSRILWEWPSFSLSSQKRGSGSEGFTASRLPFKTRCLFDIIVCNQQRGTGVHGHWITPITSMILMPPMNYLVCYIGFLPKWYNLLYDRIPCLNKCLAPHGRILASSFVFSYNLHN